MGLDLPACYKVAVVGRSSRSKWKRRAGDATAQGALVPVSTTNDASADVAASSWKCLRMRSAGWAVAAALSLVAPPLAAEPTAVARFPDPATPPAVGTRTTSTPLASEKVSWATRSAQYWYAKAQRQERHHGLLRALEAYSRAIREDSTFGPAYLAMARLREQMGDVREAEAIYTHAAHLLSVESEALARRAVLRHQQGRRDEALRDLQAAVETGNDTTEYLGLLARWYVEQRNWAASLAVHRRLEARLRGSGQTERAAQVHVQVRALVMLAGETDPVTSGLDCPDWVRRSLAEISR